MPKNQSPGSSLLMAYSWQSLVSGPHPDGPGCPEKVEINLPKHPKQLLFQQLCPKINPWCCPGSGPPGTCRRLPRPSGPEIRDAFHILGPWGSRGIQRYPPLGCWCNPGDSPGGVVVQIYKKTSQKGPEIPGKRTKSNSDFLKTIPLSRGFRKCMVFQI